MNADRLRGYLEEMQQVAEETMAFVAGVGKDAFLTDVIRQRAVALNLLMIGEATSRIMDEYPEFAERVTFPWQEIGGMRDRIVPDRMRIDLDMLWDTVQTTIPALVEALYGLRHWRAEGE